jgi:hypothetical protein
MLEKLQLLCEKPVTINTNIKVNKGKMNRNKIKNKYSISRQAIVE